METFSVADSASQSRDTRKMKSTAASGCHLSIDLLPQESKESFPLDLLLIRTNVYTVHN